MLKCNIEIVNIRINCFLEQEIVQYNNLHLFYWRLHIPFFLTHEFHKNVISSRQVDEKSLIFGEIIFKSYRDTHSDLCDCHGLCALSAPVSANKPLSCIMYIYSD